MLLPPARWSVPEVTLAVVPDVLPAMTTPRITVPVKASATDNRIVLALFDTVMLVDALMVRTPVELFSVTIPCV